MIVFRKPTANEETFDQVREELLKVSSKLLELLPDPSLSPMERLERLARVIPKSTMLSEHHKTGRSKLNELRYRLAELVPDESLSSSEKIDFLVKRIHELVPEDLPRLYYKLEKLGDQRRSDIGR